jgi:hypothetical protein
VFVFERFDSHKRTNSPAQLKFVSSFNSEFTKKINKEKHKTDKNTKFFVNLLILFVILFVNSLLKQQSTQLPAMKAVISHENFY